MGPPVAAEFLYIDISTTASWNEDTVGYIDLDLDQVRPYGGTEVSLDDANKFEEHRLRWSYPKTPAQERWTAVAQVRKRFEQGGEPFTPASSPGDQGRP